MAQHPATVATSHVWYPRPVFFVSDIQRAIDFYVDMLRFHKKWHKDTVCQVDRSDCEIILCQDANRADRGRLFVELTKEGHDQLVAEVAERSVPNEKTWWGYDCIKVADPDGNELLFAFD